MKNSLVLTFAICCWGAILLKPAKADLIVTLEDVQVNAGDFGSVDVWVESAAGGNLDAFQYKFEILDAASNIGDLRFTSPQSSSETSQSNYVHAGDSGGFISVPQNTPAFDEILGGDFTDSFNGTNLTERKLLVRLEIEHILPQGTPLESADGDQFAIRLVEDSDTFFLTNSFDTVVITSADGGEVTVTAVPEPSSSVLTLALIGLGLSTRRKPVHRALTT